MSKRSFLIFLAVFVGLVVVSQRKLSAAFRWPYPALNELIISEKLTADIASIIFGAHRVAAEIAYVQMLQYYAQEEEHAHDDDAYRIDLGGGRYMHDEAGGYYPLLKEKALRYLRLDPFFASAIIESAGALAFNQKRIGEALDLLNEAIERNPTNFRYHVYVTAILYKGQGEDREPQLIKVLEGASQDPRCPPLFLGVLGNLLKKRGDHEGAARAYLQMLERSRDEGYRKDAEGKLIRLIKENPHILKTVPELRKLF